MALREKLSRTTACLRTHALTLSLCILVAFCATTARARTTNPRRQAKPRAVAVDAARADAPTRTPTPARPASPATQQSGANAPTQNAQTQADAAQPTNASNVSPEEADIAITAHVTARELRFEKVPNPTVEFNGQPKRETVWEGERENLPRPVRPGETYRDIGIRLRILSVFADIDRIVAEALGELPASDETKPPASPPPSTTPKPDETQPTLSPSAPAANPPTGKVARP